MTEEGDPLDEAVFTDNSERVVAQNALDIRVIVGNPPYSVGQKSANDANQNESYPTLDARIAETYAARTKATNKNALYDSYVRAFRWASDRIGGAGIICFVSNAGWVDGQAMAGMRQCLAEEFNSIYVFHLRGNQRTQGEESRREGGKIFGSGSRTPVAITMLVKNPASAERGRIYFRDIGDYLTREEKLAIVTRAAWDGIDDWVEVHPDKHGDWLDQRDDSFGQFAPMGLAKYKEPQGMFATWSRGYSTGRDAWIYSFSRDAVLGQMKSLLKVYESERKRYESSGEGCKVDDFVTMDEKKIKWNRSLLGILSRGEKIRFSEKLAVPVMYRPFCKQWVYSEYKCIDMTYQQPRLFPLAAGAREKDSKAYQQESSYYCENLVIDVSDRGAFMTRTLPDLELIHHGQCFPFYWYEEAKTRANKNDGQQQLFSTGARGKRYARHDAITDEALEVFRGVYPGAFPGRAKKDGGREITKEDVFYYVYGVLHSPEYRERFGANLKKELPRIPLARDFAVFSRAGRELAHWHLDYESVDPYPLEEVGDGENPGRTEKITFDRCKKDEEHPKGEDRSVLHVAENLVLQGVPEGTYGYVVNGKSAIGWLMGRYQAKTDKASGIVNDPNEYSEDPRYIVDLVKRVVRVSLETIEIVNNLPPLDELPQPPDWPPAWKASEEG